MSKAKYLVERKGVLVESFDTIEQARDFLARSWPSNMYVRFDKGGIAAYVRLNRTPHDKVLAAQKAYAAAEDKGAALREAKRQADKRALEGVAALREQGAG